jgi:hypothetical protein
MCRAARLFVVREVCVCGWKMDLAECLRAADQAYLLS